MESCRGCRSRHSGLRDEVTVASGHEGVARIAVCAPPKSVLARRGRTLMARTKTA
jgi:hypothetical protein